MAISHKDHNHPNTPAARAACRKGRVATTPQTSGILAVVPGGGVMTVVPRKRGDGGVVKGMKATKPKVSDRRLKVSGSKIKSLGDLADVPHALAVFVRRAWTEDLDVVAGYPFNESERRIVVLAEVGEISMVWDGSDRTACFVRSYDSSITRRVDNGAEAFRIARDADAWPWRADDGTLI